MKKKILIVCAVGIVSVFLTIWIRYNYIYSNKLYMAIKRNDAMEIENLLDNSFGNINSARSPFSVLCRMIDYENVYPLEIAAKKNPYYAYEIINRGAKTNVTDTYLKSTPLIYALNSNNSERYALARYLVECGSDIEHVDIRNNTAINCAAMRFKEDDETVISQNIELIELLISKCDNLSKIEDKSGTNPLIVASEYNNLDVVKYLLEKGYYDVNATSFGMSALMKAAKYGHIEICELLISAGADTKLLSDSGNTAYDYALKSENTELIELLKP